MTFSHPKWHTPASWIGLAFSIGILAAHANHFDFINDDAFISFRYADTLVQHGELTFNVGERVEGYTNFLWTMVIALVLALGGDAVSSSKFIGIGFGGATLTALFLFFRWWRASHNATMSPLWGTLAPFLLAINPPFACWSEGGLETSMFTFWVTAAALRYLVEIDNPDPTAHRRRPWSAALLALAAMTRPEGVLMFGLFGLHRLGTQIWTERRGFPDRQIIIWGFAFVAIYLPYWIWRYTYYGYPFPNTYYAKGGEPLWSLGFLYVSSFIADCHLWVALPLIAFPWRLRGQRNMITLTLFVSVTFMIYIMRVGGDFMALYRFLIPILPMIALVSQTGATAAWRTFALATESVTGGPPTLRTRTPIIIAAVTLSVILCLHNWRLTQRSLEIGSVGGVDSIGWLKMFVEQLTPIGKHLAETESPDTSIAITAAGVVPYYSRLKTLDLLALNDVYTAHNVKALRKRPGHAKSAPEAYVLKWKPTLLIWQPRLSPGEPRPRGNERQYWRQRGYTFEFAKVPGLEPPFWSFYRRDQTPSAINSTR